MFLLSQTPNQQIIINTLGLQPYSTVWIRMKEFTKQRTQDTVDELWLLEHNAVFTQGQSGKSEHLLSPYNINIPVIYSDRGGQITYHAPGQLIIYFLLDLKRKKISIRDLINIIEQSIIKLLKQYNIIAHVQPKARGVYVNNAKICSLGFRVSRGCCYHGLALNVKMNLEPFNSINPCGYPNLKIIQISDLGGPDSVAVVSEHLLQYLIKDLGYNNINIIGNICE